MMVIIIMIIIIRMKTIHDRTEQDSKKRERLSEAQESGNWNNFKNGFTRKAKEFTVEGEGESKQETRNIVLDRKDRH